MKNLTPIDSAERKLNILTDQKLPFLDKLERIATTLTPQMRWECSVLVQ